MIRWANQWAIGAVLLAVYAAIWTWQTPGWLQGPLTEAEIATCTDRVEREFPLPADERHQIAESLRAWARADDGRPVYMLNLMRYYPELRRYEGAPPFAGTPQESNAQYEDRVMPLAFALGSYPLAAGETQGANLLEKSAELDNWSRVILMRYPSRRAVLTLFSSPDYMPEAPYKLMALRVVLTPVHTELLIPEWRWLSAGLLLAVFLGVGWARAARRLRT
jgi:uncharacterized protein (DUF1330 family)